MGPQRAPLNFNVTAYVGGNNLVIFYIEQQGGSVTKALQGKISSASGKFKQKLVITIPADLQQPAPGLYAALTDLKSTLLQQEGQEQPDLVERLQEEEAHVRREADVRRRTPRPPPKPTRLGHLDREVLVVALGTRPEGIDGPASAGPSSF